MIKAASSNSKGPDIAAIKAKQQATWASGDFSVVGVTLQVVGELLCEAVDVRAGERVLDVAAGNGNASLAAARRFAKVVSSDYVPALLENGKQRAAADRLPMEFLEADVEKLPLPDASFDVVLSTYGVMFSPAQEVAAAELLRVCRPGGRIGLVSWTPEGFIGEMFKVIGAFVPPPAGLRSPVRWGTEQGLKELFGDGARAIRSTKRSFAFRYHSPEHWLETFRAYYGPMLKAFAAIEPIARVKLEEALLDHARRFNRSGDATLVAEGTYLETVIDR